MSLIERCAFPGDGNTLLVMLPGAGSEAADFARHGLVAAAQRAVPGLDVVAVRPDIELYLDGRIIEVLHEEVILPALARGYTRLWLLGISLGGMGALLYASAHAEHIEGVLLLAPFLGTRGTIAALERAGGLATASVENAAATPTEARLLGWLQAHLQAGAARPALYLGYGEADRFAPGHLLLAGHLPPARVVTVPGGHDWPSWSALWNALLARWTPA
jgi:pimeloyl-ACP methyl ester carboxylesterase